MIAGREATTLEYIIDNQQHGHDYYHDIDKVRPACLTSNLSAQHIAEAKDIVDQCTDTQSEDKVPAGVGAVRNNAIDKLGNTVDNADQGKNDAKTRIGNTVLFLKKRHGKRKIFPHKIKDSVPQHRTDNDAPLPIMKAMFCLHIEYIVLCRFDVSNGKGKHFQLNRVAKQAHLAQ